MPGSPLRALDVLFAAAISHHPDTAQAVGENVGQVLETLGTHPDLIILFATPHHARAIGPAAQAVQTLLSPTALIGGIAASVLADGAAVEGAPGLALWAANVGPIRTFALDDDDGWCLPEWLRSGPSSPLRTAESRPVFEPRNVLVLTGPGGPSDQLAERLSALLPGAAVFGGALARQSATGPLGGAAAGPSRGSAAGALPRQSATGPLGPRRGPAPPGSASRLLLGPDLRAGGAVGVALGRGLQVSTHVISGTVPVGPPMVVTEASGPRIAELDTEPARARLLDVALDAVAIEDLQLLARSLYVRNVGRGEPAALCPVVAMDRRTQTITLAGRVSPGDTVRFLLPAPDADVAAQTTHVLEQAQPGSSALIFPAASRFRALLPASDSAGLGRSAPLADPVGLSPAVPATLEGVPAIGCALLPPLAPGATVVEAHPLGVVIALLSTATEEFTEHLPFGQGDTR